MPRDKIESTPKDDPLNDYLNEDRVSRDKSGIRDLLPPKQEPEAETSEYSLRNSSSRKSKSLREKLLSNNPALETDPKKQVNFGLAAKFRNDTKNMSNDFRQSMNNDFGYENPYTDPIRCAAPPTLEDSIRKQYFGDVGAAIGTVNRVSGVSAIGGSLAKKLVKKGVEKAVEGLALEIGALATGPGALAAAGAVGLSLIKDAADIKMDYDEKRADFKYRCEPLKLKLNLNHDY